MNNRIEFETDTYIRNRPLPQAKGITGFLISSGLAKNETAASVMLIITALLLLLGSALLLTTSTQPAEEPYQPDPDSLIVETT